MSDPTPDPEPDPAGTPRLLTIAQAAEATGLSRKAIARRAERGTLRYVHSPEGQRMIPHAELDRAGLLDRGSPGGEPASGGEIVIWRDLYEREREDREQAEVRAQELREQLVAIANAGPIRALRLRRQFRVVSATDTSPAPPTGP